MKKILENLSIIDSISGNEKKIINYIISKLPSNYEPIINNFGNIVVKTNKNIEQNNKIAIFCSVDEPGLIINKIEKDGSLHFLPIGPVKSNSLVGSIVQINDQFGVIGQKPIHLQNEEEKKSNTKIDNLYIDVGINKENENKKLIKIGDFANFKSDFLEFGNNRFTSKNINCKIGATILLKLLSSNYEICSNNFIFLTKTLICGFGAETISNFINSNIAIILDYIDEKSIYEDFINKKNETIDFVIYKNPQTNDTIFKAAVDAAKLNKFKFLVKIKNKLDETEKSIMKIKNGINIVKILVPCRHSNSRFSNVSLNNMEQTFEFLKKLFINLANLTNY